MADQSSEPTFANLYRPMSEQELLTLAKDWHSLQEDAQAALAAEFATRLISFTEPMPLQEEALPEFRDLVTIRRYRDLSEALVARSAVESAGIFCFLKDENTIRLDWQISNMIGGIRLQVAAVDAEAAEAVLNEPIPDVIEFLDEPDFQQPRCPRCESTDINYERSSRGSALVSLYLLGLPLPRGSASWNCNKCGLRWEEADDESPVLPVSETP